MSKPPIPPFDRESAHRKVQAAEDAWNSRDPDLVAQGYTEDSVWRNRDEFISGREQIVEFLRHKWARERDYALRKELWCWQDNRIAVHYQYESRDADGQWWRSYGNELWEFAADGRMNRRESSIDDIAITADQRRIFGPRPDDERDAALPLR